jgi:hypothetical protein
MAAGLVCFNNPPGEIQPRDQAPPRRGRHLPQPPRAEMRRSRGGQAARSLFFPIIQYSVASTKTPGLRGLTQWCPRRICTPMKSGAARRWRQGNWGWTSTRWSRLCWPRRGRSGRRGVSPLIPEAKAKLTGYLVGRISPF